MHDDLCQIIRDYFQSFGKGCQIIRRDEFLEVRYPKKIIVVYKIKILLVEGIKLSLTKSLTCPKPNKPLPKLNVPGLTYVSHLPLPKILSLDETLLACHDCQLVYAHLCKPQASICSTQVVCDK